MNPFHVNATLSIYPPATNLSISSSSSDSFFFQMDPSFLTTFTLRVVISVYPFQASNMADLEEVVKLDLFTEPG